MKLNFATYCNIKLACLLIKYPVVMLLFLLMGPSMYAQSKKGKVDEISITSSFKPSIVKTSKLEFFPEVPLKDTNNFRFTYDFDPVNFKTPLSPFSLKPLAYQLPEPILDQYNSYAKVGAGNLNTPFVSAGYQQRLNNSLISLGVDHISSKGKLPNQQYANSSFTGRLKQQVADNQSFVIDVGYNGDAYRNYGYDTSKFNFNGDSLKQKYNNYHVGLGYDLVTGRDASLFIKPTLNFDFLTTRRGAKETNLQLAIPVTYVVDNDVRLSAGLQVDYVHLNDETLTKKSLALVQLPVKIDYLVNGLFASGGIIPFLNKGKVSVAPQAKLVYTFKEGAGVRLLAGISNLFNSNSLHKLYEINPFLLTPEELTVFQQTNYYAGFDWLNAKGLSLQTKLGVVRFKNLPLFINGSNSFEIPSGKDFILLNEEKANAFFIEANLGYIFSDKLSFQGALSAYSFQAQTSQEYPYGILPIALTMDLSWKPIKGFSTKLVGQLFGGNMAFETGKTPFRTKGIFDLGLAVEYKLNKKWAIWTDLNNIANAKYQRWNGYTSFGFNFLLGIKFNFIQTSQ